LVIIALLFGASAAFAGSGCRDEGGGPGEGGEEFECEGVNFSPCETDSDCFSAFCDTSESPPYCHVPTHIARDALHGYDCASDDDCADVAQELIEAGGGASCYNDFIYAGCSFWCPE
jgi:hypothetical protein